MLTNNKFFGNKNIDYNVYKIIPDINIENNQNEVIARAISTLYKTPLENFKLDIKGMQITYKSKRRIMFDILLVPNNAYFYFTLPKESEELFLNKIKSIWNNAAIIKVKEDELSRLNDFNSNSTVINLILKTFNFKGINVAKDNLYPLSNMIGLVSELKADCGECVRLNFNVEPIKRSNWINKANDEYNSYKKGKIVDNEKTIKENITKGIFKTFEYGINMYIEFRLMIFESLLGIIVPKEKENEKLELILNSVASTQEENKYIGLSNSTTHKMTSETFSTGITIISKSTNVNRRDINLVTVANSYKDLNNDNELVIKRLNNKDQKKAIKSVIANKPTNHRSIYSDKEIAKFIQLPQKTLQQLYKLDNIDNREITVPIELQAPGVSIGVAEVKREKVKVYWSNDFNSMALPKVVAGPPGSGKSKYTENFIVGANKLGHCTIVFDYIKNCELSNTASKYTKNNVIIDLSNREEIFAFAYPELSNRINVNSSNWDRIEVATEIGKQVKYLVDSINDDNTGSLTGPMVRYLMAATKIVFIHEGEKVDNVFRVLEDWKIRNEYIRKSKDIYNYDDRVISTLRELNDTDDKGKVIGTRQHLIQGVLNRIDLLLDDPRLELMLRADIDNKHNFTKYMNEGKAIYIKIPQSTFRDATTKDIIVTYFLTRIWSAALERSNIDKPNICHIITDEVHQVQIASNFMKNHITEFRKFGLAPLFTIHYLKQFKTLLDAVKSSGASYMLLNGLERENLEMLKQEIQPFTIDEAMNLGEWESLNIIKHNNKYSKFISKLPIPIG